MVFPPAIIMVRFQTKTNAYKQKKHQNSAHFLGSITLHFVHCCLLWNSWNTTHYK